MPSTKILDEAHHISERVTRVETQVASISASVSSLAETVGAIGTNISELKSMMGGVGKTDGKTIVTLGIAGIGAIISAVVVVSGLFLSPVQRDVAYIGKETTTLERRMSDADATILGKLEEHVKVTLHPGDAVRFSETDGRIDLLEWRLKALEEKR